MRVTPNKLEGNPCKCADEKLVEGEKDDRAVEPCPEGFLHVDDVKIDAGSENDLAVYRLFTFSYGRRWSGNDGCETGLDSRLRGNDGWGRAEMAEG